MRKLRSLPGCDGINFGRNLQIYREKVVVRKRFPSKRLWVPTRQKDTNLLALTAMWAPNLLNKSHLQFTFVCIGTKVETENSSETFKTYTNQNILYPRRLSYLLIRIWKTQITNQEVPLVLNALEFHAVFPND